MNSSFKDAPSILHKVCKFLIFELLLKRTGTRRTSSGCPPHLCDVLGQNGQFSTQGVAGSHEQMVSKGVRSLTTNLAALTGQTTSQCVECREPVREEGEKEPRAEARASKSRTLACRGRARSRVAASTGLTHQVCYACPELHDCGAYRRGLFVYLSDAHQATTRPCRAEQRLGRNRSSHWFSDR